MKPIRTLVVLSLLLIGAFASRAQPSSVQQLQLNQQTMQQQLPLPGLRPGTNAPELYQGENQDIGPQHILRMNPRPKYLDVYLDSEIYYSDNATFADAPDHIGSFIYLNTVQVAITPPPMDLGPGRIAPQIGFSSQWYDYDKDSLHSLDFNAQTAFVGTKYTLGKWLLNANVNYTRLLSQDNDYHEIYHEFLPSLSAQYFFVINDSMLLAVGDQVDYHVTKTPSVFGTATTFNDHLDNVIFATFNWQATDHLSVQPYYRFQYSFYRRGQFQNTAGIGSNRDDYLNAAGVTLIYTFNPNFSARVFSPKRRSATSLSTVAGSSRPPGWKIIPSLKV